MAGRSGSLPGRYLVRLVALICESKRGTKFMQYKCNCAIRLELSNYVEISPAST